MKVVSGVIGGLILAILGTTLFAFSTAGANPEDGKWGAIAFLVLWVAGIVIALKAPSAPKAWRRLLITCGVLAFLLPLSGIIFTGTFMAHNVDPNAEYAGAQAAGAAIGGGLFSGLLAFVGFFLGLVFLVIGLLVGRDKQIVYLQAPPPAPASR